MNADQGPVDDTPERVAEVSRIEVGYAWGNFRWLLTYTLPRLLVAAFVLSFAPAVYYLVLDLRRAKKNHAGRVADLAAWEANAARGPGPHAVPPLDEAPSEVSPVGAGRGAVAVADLATEPDAEASRGLVLVQ